MTELAVTGIDLNEPLRWETDDTPAKRGTEIAFIPRFGRIYFYDNIGPVVRVDNVCDARWRCVFKIQTGRGLIHRFRITVLKRYDETFVNVIPGVHAAETIHCTRQADHDGCEEWYCARVGERLDALIR